jgi:preprotein translocase subunit SecG
VLTRTTALLAAGFFLTSLALSWLAGIDRKPTSIINTNGGEAQEAPLGAPTAPLSSGSGGVLNQLQQGSPGRPAAPAPAPAPSGPQVPESK